MPNIATVLKEEIVRLARKELRGETASLKKAVSAHRSDIAALKRRVADLEKSNKALQRQLGQKRAAEPAAPGAEGDDGTKVRFRADGLASNRKRLGLSAEDFGLLVGASGQSVHKWEQGTTPRAKYLPAIAALRGIGKKEVAARLAQLK